MKTKLKKRTPLYVDPNRDGGESLRKYIEYTERKISGVEDEIEYEVDLMIDTENKLEDLRDELDDLRTLRLDLLDELDNCKDCADGL